MNKGLVGAAGEQDGSRAPPLEEDLAFVENAKAAFALLGTLVRTPKFMAGSNQRRFDAYLDAALARGDALVDAALAEARSELAAGGAAGDNAGTGAEPERSSFIQRVAARGEMSD